MSKHEIMIFFFFVVVVVNIQNYLDTAEKINSHLLKLS